MADSEPRPEQLFGAVYGTPLARAAAGLASEPSHRPPGADPARRELARREAQDLLASAGTGTLRDGIVRILLLLMNEQGAVDERTYRALRAVREELPARQRPTPAEMRETARRQALLLRSDRGAAVRGLATIFADPKDRATAEAALRKAVEMVGFRVDPSPKGPLARLLHQEGEKAGVA